MYPILKAEKLADKIYLMVVEAPRVDHDRIPDRGSFYREDEHPQGWGCIP